jgi:hypothetical protein
MEQFVGLPIENCIKDLLIMCDTLPLVIEQTTSRKVIGSGDVRVLRIQQSTESVTCLVGVY